MRQSNTLLLLATLVLVACSKPSKPEPVIRDDRTVATPKRPSPRLSADDPRELALRIADAQHGSFDGRADSFAAIRKRWRGKRYRWPMRFLPALCPRADSCHLLPFDHQRFDSPVVQGWLPRLELDAAQHSALKQQCRPHTRCVVEIEGVLSELRLSTAEATAITLSAVVIAASRQARDDESWALRTRS